MCALHENHDNIINCKSHSLTLKAYITNNNFLSAFKICYLLKCFWSLHKRCRSRSDCSWCSTGSTLFASNHVQTLNKEPSGSMVECLTQDWGAVGSSFTSITVLCPWARHINPSLVLVQPRKTHPYITERLLMGLKNQIKQNSRLLKETTFLDEFFSLWF